MRLSIKRADAFGDIRRVERHIDYSVSPIKVSIEHLAIRRDLPNQHCTASRSFIKARATFHLTSRLLVDADFGRIHDEISRPLNHLSDKVAMPFYAHYESSTTSGNRVIQI